MSWNDSGDRDNKGKGRDPWGSKGEQGPPDLDEALRQFQRKLRGMFGKEGPKGPDGTTPLTPQSKKNGIWLILGTLAAVYVLSGIYVIQPAEEAVILRFGRYARTEGPGPHWIARFVESKEVINVQEVKTTKHGGQMLTKDENIVSAEIAVQYRISNARDYLFNVVQPERSLQQVSESALRTVVGQSTLNQVLTSGRSEIGAEILKQVQQNLDNYASGLTISDLAMQQTKAPEEVKAAFDDAIKAQQDEERLVNEAEAYARKIVPIAEGQAIRTLEEAKAYKERVILESQGKTAKFSKILPEYRKAPEVMRERLFLETLQEVYSKTSKVMIDVDGGNNVVYLPLERILKQNGVDNILAARAKEEEEASVASGEKARIIVNETLPAEERRPSYSEAERPSRGGD
jgi:modulator of FtsH protease HflK